MKRAKSTERPPPGKEDAETVIVAAAGVRLCCGGVKKQRALDGMERSRFARSTPYLSSDRLM